MVGECVGKGSGLVWDAAEEENRLSHLSSCMCTHINKSFTDILTWRVKTTMTWKHSVLEGLE